MSQIEPLYWMGQTLGFVIMAAVMGVWRQAATVAGTSLASQTSWKAIIGVLSTQAGSRFLLGLSSQLDLRIMANQGLEQWGLAPFGVLSLIMGATGLALLAPLWSTVGYKLGLSVMRARILGISSVGLSMFASIWLAKTSTGFLDMCAGLSLVLLGSAMFSLAVKNGAGFGRVKIASSMAAVVGLVFVWASFGEKMFSLESTMAAMAGSLVGLCGLHARVEQITKGKVGEGWRMALFVWVFAWLLLGVGGPSLWRAAGSVQGGFKDYMFALGMLCAFFVVSWHFRRLNIALAIYIEDLGRDRSKALLSGLDAAAFLIDSSGMVVDCSKEATRLCALSLAQLKHTTIWNSLGVDPMATGSVEARDAEGRYLVLTLVELGEAHESLSALTVRNITSERISKIALDKAAREDELTGLPNRREALSIVDQAIESSRGVAGLGLLFMDLDHFKNVNDTEGHAAGDALLREVAAILEESIKESGGWLARLGGDEFLGVLLGAGEEKCVDAAYRCIASMERSTRAAKGSVGISVGISLFPRDGDTGIDLIRRADAAMYESKGNGRGRVSMFGEAIESRLMRRVQVEGFLREALKMDQGLTMFLQPLCNMDGVFSGQAEALIRAPGMPGLGAQELISIAEKSGLILPLGRWVLRQAGTMQRDAQKAGVPLILSINVSSRQFMDEMFWEMFRGMARLGQFARGITLEVTETTLMEDVERSARLLSEARTLGATVALDDFGAGYSSLSTLKRIPLDKLKLDKSLLDQVPEEHEAKRVAQAAIAMASALGLEVVAEGVERPEQAKWLKSKGVFLAQGYLFAKPMPPEKLFELASRGVSLKFMGEPK